MEKLITAVALCAVGAEKAVSNELKKLSAAEETQLFKVEESLYGRVRFKTNTTGLYQALIGLRAADRVLLEAAVYEAADFDALFEGAAAVKWESIIPKGMGLKISKVRTNRSRLKAETSIQAIIHKAAARRLCEKYKMNRLPEPEIIPRQKKGDDDIAGLNQSVKTAEVRVYIEKDIVSLLIDLSGKPLFKRGYRSEGGAAPLRETTAASLLLLSGWKRKFPLYDPFCGSGTILIEAVMYAWDMAPGLGRHFALEDMLIADEKTEQSVREKYRSKINFGRLIRIAGSDEDLRSVSIAASNLARLRDIAEGREPQRGIHPRSLPQKREPSASGSEKDFEDIKLEVLPMSKAVDPFSQAGFIVTNPPYGKRLADREAAEVTYKEMGRLENRFPEWKLAVITDHSGFESFYGKKADSCREISNGAIPSYFFQYELI